jgi:hypothetical protein
MELWPFLLFLLLISGTAGAGNTNFFFFETQLSPEIFYGPGLFQTCRLLTAK